MGLIRLGSYLLSDYSTELIYKATVCCELSPRAIRKRALTALTLLRALCSVLCALAVLCSHCACD